MMKPKSGIAAIQPYQGGKPIEEVERELGISDIIKLASNENPLGPAPLAVEAIRENAGNVHLYPDGNAYYLKQDLADHLRVEPENLILGNGSNEVLQIIGETYISPGDEVVYSDQAFVVYMLVSRICGASSVTTPLRNQTHDLEAMVSRITDRTRVVFIANPNNPTGTMVTTQQVERFMSSIPDDVLVVFDEAYYEYVERDDYPQALQYVHEGRNVLVTRTFSKIYGLAGLRIGYGIAPVPIISMMNRVRQPFNANMLAQVAARASLKDTEHVQRSRSVNAEGKIYLYEQFGRLGLEYVPSDTNFILVHVPNEGQAFADALLQQGVIVRPMAGYKFPQSVRITIGTEKENERLVHAMTQVLERGVSA